MIIVWIVNVKIFFAAKVKTISLENQKGLFMTKKILQFSFFIFCVLIFKTSFGIPFTAIVLDSVTHQPLQGVAILHDNKVIATTNSIGYFELQKQATEKNFSISLKYFGYQIYETVVDISKDDYNNSQTIYLIAISHELNAITISGSKFEKRLNEETVSIEVVKPKQIQDAGITQMDDMLKRIPGVDVVDGQPNIRGGSGWSYGAGSRVLVMVDDMPMLTSDAGDVKWDFLPIENCEQVEVLKGAASALYGSSALNGVINFRTAFPRNTPQTNIVIQQGIYDSPKNIYEKWTGNNVQKFHGANFFHSRKIKQLDLVIGGNYYTDDSYLQGNYNTRGRLNTNLRYRFKHIDGLSVGLNINAQKAQGSNFFVWGADGKATTVGNKYYPDSTAYLTPRGGVDTPSTSLSFSKTYRYTIDPYISYNTKSGLKINFRNRFFNMNNENNTNQNSNAKLYYSELQAQKMFVHQLNFTTGIVANYSDVHSQLFGNHTANNFAYYLQAEKKIGNRLWLAIGGRYEFYRVDTVKAITKPLGRIGLNYEVAKATFLRASYGMGYRFPTIAEKYVNTYVSGVNVFPNTQLKSETGWNAELGVKQNFILGKLLGMLDLAGFYTRYNNMMEFTFDYFPQVKNFGFQSRNVANTLVKGIDVSIFMQRKLKSVEINLHSGFTYILPQDLAFDTMNRIQRQIRYSDTTQNILKYRYTTSWKTDVELKWKKFTFGSYVRYNTYVVNIDQAFNFIFPSVADYRKKWSHKDTWIIDARLQYQLNKNASLAFIVKNMLNFEYTERPGEIAPVRNFTMQFVYKF